MPLKGPRKLSGVALELSDPNARFRVNRVDSVAAGMHSDEANKGLSSLPEDSVLETNGHANMAFEEEDEEEDEARDELPPILTTRRPSAAYLGTMGGGGGTQYGGALNQMTREALPRLDNYRNLMSITSGHRPTTDELRDTRAVNKVTH
jgi:hypothetical protein